MVDNFVSGLELDEPAIELIKLVVKSQIQETTVSIDLEDQLYDLKDWLETDDLGGNLEGH